MNSNKTNFARGMKVLAVFVLLAATLCGLVACGQADEKPAASANATEGNGTIAGESVNVGSEQPTAEATAAATEPPATEAPTRASLPAHVDPARKMVALTFDDGPSKTVTNAILDKLEEHGGRATFFCLGDRVNEYESTLRRMVALNCQVASHSNAHKHLVKLGGEALQKDLKQALDSIEKYSGVRPTVMRTPYGEHTDALINQIDMPVILWSIDTRDWCYHVTKNDKRTAAEIERDCQTIIHTALDNVQDGDIILMHDLYSTTQRSAVEIIDRLAEDGWQMVTIDELFAAKGIALEPRKFYRSAKGK